MDKIFEARRWASLFLEQHEREGNVADLLLAHHLGLSRAQLFAEFREEMPEHVKDLFIEDIKKHGETGVPVQHLIGYETFFDRKFVVNRDVLIPRPETEELILGVMERLQAKGWLDHSLTGVDVGTGSGIIAITLAKEVAGLKMFASDVSKEALITAESNAEELEAAITFEQGSFLTPFIEKNQTFDVIVSNPPYIPEGDRDSLSDVVRDYDPALALFAGEDGLTAYRQIVSQVPQVKKEKTLLAFEIGHNQGEQVSAIIQSTFPEAEVEVQQDMNKKDRMVYAWLK